VEAAAPTVKATATGGAGLRTFFGAGGDADAEGGPGGLGGTVSFVGGCKLGTSAGQPVGRVAAGFGGRGGDAEATGGNGRNADLFNGDDGAPRPRPAAGVARQARLRVSRGGTARS